MKSIGSRLRRGGSTKLFAACQARYPSLDTIRQLLQAQPEHIKSRDGEHFIPLHWVLRNKPTLDLVQYLVQAWPESTREKDKYGRTCVHMACLCHASLAVVAYLIEQWPLALKIADKDGFLPLHSACFQRSSSAVIHCIVTTWPDALVICNLKGRTPLDLCAPSFNNTSRFIAPELITWLDSVAASVDRTQVNELPVSEDDTEGEDFTQREPHFMVRLKGKV